MGTGAFRMNTSQVNQEGLNITDLADAFGNARNAVKQTKDRIIASNFTSDDAIAIGNTIETYEPMLNQIQQKLQAHGDFGLLASRKTNEANENIKNMANKYRM